MTTRGSSRTRSTQVAQSFLFALGAEAFVKLDRLEKRLLDGDRVSSDVLELADIAF